MNSLVTGYHGFLASHVVRALSAKQLPYYVTGRTALQSSDPAANYLHPDELLTCKIHFESIFHLAAYIPLRGEKNTTLILSEANVDYTARLCKFLRFEKMIFSSSVSVYGDEQRLPLNEQSDLLAQDDYGMSKIKAEQWVKGLRNYAIIRFSSLYGPGMSENTIIPMYINQALGRGMITVFGEGTRRQNYLYVEDAVALLMTAQQSVATGVFLGTDTRSYSNLELAELIADATGAQLEFHGTDATPSAIYDNSFTREALSWEPKTSLETGIVNYIEWKRRQF